jgi:hypothetical protein
VFLTRGLRLRLMSPDGRQYGVSFVVSHFAAFLNLARTLSASLRRKTANMAA